jgi:Holliday junction resolvasome RuvABC DNA-binding subunit
MARLKNEVQTKIYNMIAEGEEAKAIAKATGVREVTIQKMIDELTDEKEETGAPEAETVNWKERYLTAHAQLVELGAL